MSIHRFYVAYTLEFPAEINTVRDLIFGQKKKPTLLCSIKHKTPVSRGIEKSAASNKRIKFVIDLELVVPTTLFIIPFLSTA